MGDDWDPFAVDGADDPVNSVVQATDAPATQGRISKEDLARLEEIAWEAVCKETPWKVAPRPQPDLTWYVPVASLDSWTHKDVTIEVGQQILYVNINRPDDNNTISDKVLLGLCDAVMHLQYRKEEFRMAVFSASGKMFCAGKDPSSEGMAGFTKQPPNHVKQVWGEFQARAKQLDAFPDGNEDLGRILRAKFLHTLSSLPQFTVALVNGSAIGEGVGFAACCDAVLSVPEAYFNVTSVYGGTCDPLWVPYLEKRIGPCFTKLMLCTGENVSAEKAKFYGLVSEVVDDIEKGHESIKKLAGVLTACGPRSVEAAKNLVIGVAGQQISEGLMYFTAQQLAMVTVSKEAKDGMACVQIRADKPWEKDPYIIKPLH
jgi:enoyl-CoA hydratase/carnithine racemase